jgi:hypothetical protein
LSYSTPTPTIVDSPVVRPEDYRPTRADVVREASRRVPLNGLSLPEGFHKSDLLSTHVIKKIVPRSELLRSSDGEIDFSEGQYTDEGPLLVLDERQVRAAYVPLDYHEGFPTLPQGTPFWAQLPFEPTTAFKTFETYLKQGTDDGARRLFSLACIPDIQARCLGPIPSANRNIPNGHSGQDVDKINQEDQQYEREKARANETNKTLKEWHTIYYWGARARAYDLFYLDGIRQSQGMMALSLQNRHYMDAQNLYNQVLSFINGDNPESLTEDGAPRFWKEMTPRVLVDFMKVLAQIQRVSLNLPATGPAPVESPTSAVGLLHSLITNSPTSVLESRRGPGRPRGEEDGAGSSPHPPGSGTSNGGYGGTASLLSSSSSPLGLPPSRRHPTRNDRFDSRGYVGDMTDEERARKIATLFNTAKARRSANHSQDEE